MIKSTFMALMQVLGGLGAGLAIVSVLMMWRLSSGPISLGYLNSYLESELSAIHSGIVVRVDDTILTWAGWERTLDIRVVNLRLMDGPRELAKIPQTSLSFSARALLKGMAAPRSIDIFGPKVKLVRGPDGQFRMGLGDPKADARPVNEFLSALTKARPPEDPLSYLTRVSVVDGQLWLEDQVLGTFWYAPLAQLALNRTPTGLQGEASLDVQADEERIAFVAAVGRFDAVKELFDIGVEFSGVTPAEFSRLAPALSELDLIGVPLLGKIALTARTDGVLATLQFDVSGGSGSLDLPEPYPQRLPVAALAFKGRYDGPEGRLDVDDLSIDLGPGGHLLLPSPTDHVMPVRSIHAKGRYEVTGGRLDVAVLDLDLGGPSVSFEGTVEGIGGALAVAATGRVRALPIDEFDRYWPAAWGRSAHDWCVTHLADGIVPEARARLELATDEAGGIVVKTLAGDMDIEGVTVDYLPPMPKVFRTTGGASFDTTHFLITVRHGEMDGLELREGTIDLTGLDQVDQYADIRLKVNGSVRKALELIDSQPLGFASALGVVPSRASGATATDVSLKFILEHKLTLDQVDVAVTAELEDVSLTDVLFDKDLTRGSLRLRVDKKALNVIGRARLADIPSALAWQENFGKKVPFRRRYEVQGKVKDVARLADFGLDPRPLLGDGVKGGLGVTLTQTVADGGAGRLDLALDLADLAVDLPDLGWEKAVGAPGKAVFDIRLHGDALAAIESFSVTAPALSVGGGAVWRPKGGPLERLTLDSLAIGKTKLSSVVVAPQGADSWAVSLNGEVLDLGPALKAATPDEDEDRDKAGSQRLAIALNVDRVLLAADGPTGTIRGVKGRLVRLGDTWRTLDIAGTLDGGKPIALALREGEKDSRELTLRADDAGAVLRALDVYGDMNLGALDLKATYDDSKPDSPLSGALAIKDFRVVKAPLLARVLSLAALTGILESLEGDGLKFEELEAPFVLRKGTLELKDARAWGSSLGFTAGGSYYMGAKTLNIEGTVVPAYAINAAFGKIPLLGRIFSGEKGGGVFAASYTVSGSTEQPKTSVNPLTALAPGFLRNLFDIFDEPDSAPAETEPALKAEKPT